MEPQVGVAPLTLPHASLLSTGPSPSQPSDLSPETVSSHTWLGQSPGPSTGSHTGGFCKSITNSCVLEPGDPLHLL